MTTARTRATAALVWMLVAMLADQIEAQSGSRYELPNVSGSNSDDINNPEINFGQPSISQLSNPPTDNTDFRLIPPTPSQGPQQQQQSMPQGVNNESPIQDNIQIPMQNNNPPSMQDIGPPLESNNVQPQLQSMRPPQISDNDSPLVQNNDSPPSQNNVFPPTQDNVPPTVQDNLPQEQPFGMTDQTQSPDVPLGSQQGSNSPSNLNRPQEMNFDPSPTQNNAQQTMSPQEDNFINKAPINIVPEQVQQQYQQKYSQQNQPPLPQQMPTPPIVSYPQQQPTIISVPQQRPTVESNPQQRPTVVSVPQQRPTVESNPLQRPTIVSVPQQRPTVESNPQQRPTVVSIPQQRPSVESNPPQQQILSVPQQPQFSSYYSYSQIPMDQQYFRVPQQPNYQMPYQAKLPANYPDTMYNDRTQTYTNNYQVQPPNGPSHTGQSSLFPINFGNMLPTESLSAFNPIPLAQQSIGKVSGSMGGMVDKVHGYASGLQDGLTNMALNMGTTLVDGGQKAMHTIADVAMALPDAIFNAKRKTFNSMRESRQSGQSNNMNGPPQNGAYYPQQLSQNGYNDNGYMAPRPPYVPGNVQQQQQYFQDQPQQQEQQQQQQQQSSMQPINRYVMS